MQGNTEGPPPNILHTALVLHIALLCSLISEQGWGWVWGPYIGRYKVALGKYQRQFYLFIFYWANHRVKEREKGVAGEESLKKINWFQYCTNLFSRNQSPANGIHFFLWEILFPTVGLGSLGWPTPARRSLSDHCIPGSLCLVQRRMWEPSTVLGDWTGAFYKKSWEQRTSFSWGPGGCLITRREPGWE